MSNSFDSLHRQRSVILKSGYNRKKEKSAAFMNTTLSLVKNMMLARIKGIESLVTREGDFESRKENGLYGSV